MTSQDILTLAQAGFNQQQIMALVTAMQQPTQPIQQPAMVQQQYQPIQQVQTIPQPQQVQQQYQPFQQVQTVTQNPQVQQVPQPQLVQPIPANLDPVIEQINKLTSAVQANAIISSNMPQQAQTTDDILGSIINPPILQNNGGK